MRDRERASERARARERGGGRARENERASERERESAREREGGRGREEGREKDREKDKKIGGAGRGSGGGGDGGSVVHQRNNINNIKSYISLDIYIREDLDGDVLQDVDAGCAHVLGAEPPSRKEVGEAAERRAKVVDLRVASLLAELLQSCSALGWGVANEIAKQAEEVEDNIGFIAFAHSLKVDALRTESQR